MRFAQLPALYHLEFRSQTPANLYTFDIDSYFCIAEQEVVCEVGWWLSASDCNYSAVLLAQSNPNAMATEGDLDAVKWSNRHFILGILLPTLVFSSLSFSINGLSACAVVW